MSSKLQQDIVKISGKTIFINPFLYWRRFDENTNRWLRQPGQISEHQILSNRNRFYPELDWNDLKAEEKVIKEATIEMFLKTLDLISTFHPNLTSGQLLEVERKMAITKKKSFEKWVKHVFKKKDREEIREKRIYQRERFIRNWREWFAFETTQQAILPFVVIIFVTAFVGWSAGISKNSCNPYFESSTHNNF